MNSMHGPKRVLISTDASGGVWAYALEMAHALSRRRVEVDLAVLGPAANAAQMRVATALYGVTVHNTGLPLDWTVSEPGMMAFTSNALATLARERDVDLIQLHTPALVSQSLWSAPVMAVAHSCVGTWWSAVERKAPPKEVQWRLDAVRAGLQAADVVVAPTHAFAAMLRTIHGTQRRIEVVHSGRATGHAAQIAPEARRGILVAGRLWDEAKNVAVLDRAAALIGDIPMRAAGPVAGPNGQVVTLNAIEPLGVLDESEMAAAMASARIFASSALYEPFGLSVLEAAQAGLPLVLADIPSFRELWGGAAIFVPPGDVQAWATTLTTLHVQSAECRRWGMKARARAGNYTIERFDGSMWDRLCHMLDASPQAAAA